MVEAPAALVAELHHGADVLLGHDHLRLDVRLLDLVDRVGHVGRRVHLAPLGRVLRAHAVGDGRRRHEQVEVELALEPLAHDLHVQQAEEAAAEAEAERLRGLGLVEERRVVELQLLERVAELGVVVGVGREEPGEHHRLDVLVAGERLGRRPRLGGERVADAQLGDLLEPGDHVADLAGDERLQRRHHRRHRADLLRLEPRAERHRAQILARLERAVDDAHERDDAAVLVVRGVEDQRARRRVRGRRSAPGSARRPRRARPRRRSRSSPRSAARSPGRRRAARRAGARRRRGRPAAGRSCSRPGRSRGCSRSRGRRSRASAPRSPAPRRRRAARPRTPAASARPRR